MNGSPDLRDPTLWTNILAIWELSKGLVIAVASAIWISISASWILFRTRTDLHENREAIKGVAQDLADHKIEIARLRSEDNDRRDQQRREVIDALRIIQDDIKLLLGRHG
jgi:ATP-dependent protease ClpP protease subunit